jgi:hypothetical protein
VRIWCNYQLNFDKKKPSNKKLQRLIKSIRKVGYITNGATASIILGTISKHTNYSASAALKAGDIRRYVVYSVYTGKRCCTFKDTSGDIKFGAMASPVCPDDFVVVSSHPGTGRLHAVAAS